MKTIPNGQVEAVLGKNSFWLPKALVKLDYLYGLPELDTFQENNKIQCLIIKCLPNGLEIGLLYAMSKYSVGIPYSDIKHIELALPEEIITKTKENRSVIGRAIVGGLLLGPVGAIVGGMSGLKDGEKAEKTEVGDALLTISIEQEGQESFIVAKVPNSQRSLTKAYLQNNLKRFLLN